MPDIILKDVVFPAPLTPRRPKTMPWSEAHVTPRTAWVVFLRLREHNPVSTNTFRKLFTYMICLRGSRARTRSFSAHTFSSSSLSISGGTASLGTE